MPGLGHSDDKPGASDAGPRSSAWRSTRAFSRDRAHRVFSTASADTTGPGLAAIEKRDRGSRRAVAVKAINMGIW